LKYAARNNVFHGRTSQSAGDPEPLVLKLSLLYAGEGGRLAAAWRHRFNGEAVALIKGALRV